MKKITYKKHSMKINYIKSEVEVNLKCLILDNMLKL
jgi:hypothetical protein